MRGLLSRGKCRERVFEDQLPRVLGPDLVNAGYIQHLPALHQINQLQYFVSHAAKVLQIVFSPQRPPTCQRKCHFAAIHKSRQVRNVQVVVHDMFRELCWQSVPEAKQRISFECHGLIFLDLDHLVYFIFSVAIYDTH
jgi:hypothetical protein